MTDLIAGVDEIATETQLADGWTFALLPVQAPQQFEAVLASKSIGPGLKSYHGKKIQNSIRAGVSSVPCTSPTSDRSDRPVVAGILSLDKSFRDRLVPQIQRIVENALGAAGVTDKSSVTMSPL
jgi:hypothetical protein